MKGGTSPRGMGRRIRVVPRSAQAFVPGLPGRRLFYLQVAETGFQRCSRLEQKTLGAHRLAPVRRPEATYSSPRAPQRTPPGERACLGSSGWAGEKGTPPVCFSPAAALESCLSNLQDRGGMP